MDIQKVATYTTAAAVVGTGGVVVLAAICAKLYKCTAKKK